MSHFQSFVQILKMLVEIYVLLDEQFERAGGGGGGGGQQNLKYEAAKLLNFVLESLNAQIAPEMI